MKSGRVYKMKIPEIENPENLEKRKKYVNENFWIIIYYSPNFACLFFSLASCKTVVNILNFHKGNCYS